MTHIYCLDWNQHTIWSHSLEIPTFWNRTTCMLWSQKRHLQVLWFWKPNQHILSKHIKRCPKSHGWIVQLLLLLWHWSNSWIGSKRKPCHDVIGIRSTSVHRNWWTNVLRNFGYGCWATKGSIVWGKGCQGLKGRWQICCCIWQRMVQTNRLKSSFNLWECNSLLN